MAAQSRRMGSLKLILLYAGSLTCIFFLFILPLPYLAVFPGELIALQNTIKTDVANAGDFYAISVHVYENPYASRLGLTHNNFEVNILAFLMAKANKDAELIPIPPESRNLSTQMIKEYQAQLLNDSLQVAKDVASAYLQKDLDQVEFTFGDLAGSSGSLLVSLELIQKFGDQDLIRGRRIAGSGEITSEGLVLGVGGVKQKIAVAEKEQVDILILPAAERMEYTGKLKILYVAHLNETVSLLLQG